MSHRLLHVRSDYQLQQTKHQSWPYATGILKHAYEVGLGGEEPDISDWNAEEQMVMSFVCQQQQRPTKRRKKRLFEPYENFEEHYKVGVLNQLDGLRSTGVDLDTLRKSRVVIFNTWRQINIKPTNRCPLAVADKRTVTAHDGLAGGAPGRMGVTRTNTQRFYFYPDLTPEECLIFVGYDSASQSHTPCIHSAFNQPTEIDPRLSVELRCVALFPES